MTTSIPPGSIDDRSDVVITSPTNGQVLKYNGTNWVNAAESGGTNDFVLISSTDISSTSSVDLEGIDNSIYKTYLIIINKLTVATDDVQLQAQFGTGSPTVTYDSGTNYAYSLQNYTYLSSSNTGTNSGGTFIGLAWPGGTAGLGNATNENYCAQFRIYGTQSGFYARLQGDSTYARADANQDGFIFQGTHTNTSEVTGIRIKASSGNLTGGTIQLWGLK